MSMPVGEYDVAILADIRRDLVGAFAVGSFTRWRFGNSDAHLRPAARAVGRPPRRRRHSQPCSRAIWTASPRVRAPSLPRISDTLLRTAPSDSDTRVAISALARPAALAA